jgi:hypothetical protein
MSGSESDNTKPSPGYDPNKDVINSSAYKEYANTVEGTTNINAVTSKYLSSGRVLSVDEASSQYNDYVAGFNAWKARNDATAQQRAEYLKLTQEKPGRQGTIIVPTSPGDAASTISTGSSSSRKTLLG